MNDVPTGLFVESEIVNKIVYNNLLKIYKDKENLITESLKKKLNTDSLDLESLKGRLKCVRDENTKNEMYCLDDIPFIYFTDISCNLDKNEYNNDIMTSGFKYRILNY